MDTGGGGQTWGTGDGGFTSSTDVQCRLSDSTLLDNETI